MFMICLCFPHTLKFYIDLFSLQISIYMYEITLMLVFNYIFVGCIFDQERLYKLLIDVEMIFDSTAQLNGHFASNKLLKI